MTEESDPETGQNKVIYQNPDVADQATWQKLEAAQAAQDLAREVRVKMREAYPELRYFQENIHGVEIQMWIDFRDDCYILNFVNLDQERALNKGLSSEIMISLRADRAQEVLNYPGNKHGYLETR